MVTVRPAAVAGTFYPEDPHVLAASVDDLVRAADVVELPGVPKALALPHAGYVYSGPVAATGYALLGRWAASHPGEARVVLLGPAHRVATRGLALPGVEALETPLGKVPIDAPLVAELATLAQVVVRPDVHAREHSLEVHLPFLQRLLPRFTLVPLAVGDATPEEVAEVIDRAWGGAETRVIVSSDLSHYLPRGVARGVDEATAQRIERADPVEPDRACGARALNGLSLVARRRGLSVHRLDLRTSGDTRPAPGAGDQQEVVGYGAFAYVETAS